MKLLLVDDDPKFRTYIRQGLEESGFDCETASDTAEALRCIEVEHEGFDLILLDVMLPDRPGWELLRDLRAGPIATPVIFLTARHSVDERVYGLRHGADDYIIKPFEFVELLARIEAVARRTTSKIVVGEVEIDVADRTVVRGGRRIDVSPREFDVLRHLAEAKGEVCSRAELLHKVWQIDFDPGTNVVEVSILRLRRKLDVRGPQMVQTIVGKGYRLVVPTEVA